MSPPGTDWKLKIEIFLRYRTASPGAGHRRHWQRRAGEARTLSAQKFVVSSGDPLHRRCAGVYHGRSGCNPRLGGPALSRLALASVCAAEDFHSAPAARIRIAVADRALWKCSSIASLEKLEIRDEMCFAIASHFGTQVSPTCASVIL